MSSLVKRVFIRGGLGNQLFQYAYGLFLRRHFGYEVRFDISHYNFDSRHGGFMLDRVGIKDDFSSGLIFRLIVRISYKLPVFIRKLFRIYIEDLNSCDFDKSVFMLGYWQHISFASDSIKLISSLRQESVLKSGSSSHSDRYTVAIHIRRGDYLWPENLLYYGVCSKRYYIDAIEYFSRDRENCYFVLCSDDRQWVLEQFGDFLALDNFVISPSTNSVVDDLNLMCESDAIVLSNSTLSWWAATLNVKDGCTIIAPQPWLNGELDFDPCFSDWIRFSK